MQSRHHFPISVGVGVVLVLTLSMSLPWPVVVFGAGLLGTAIDLDHFLIARLRTGHWQSLRRCLTDPRLALLDQDDIFDVGDVGKATRLISHLVITVVVVGGLAVTGQRTLAVAAGTVLAVHVACDVVWDLWEIWTGSVRSSNITDSS